MKKNIIKYILCNIEIHQVIIISKKVNIKQ